MYHNNNNNIPKNAESLQNFMFMNSAQQSNSPSTLNNNNNNNLLNMYGANYLPQQQQQLQQPLQQQQQQILFPSSAPILLPANQIPYVQGANVALLVQPQQGQQHVQYVPVPIAVAAPSSSKKSKKRSRKEESGITQQAEESESESDSESELDENGDPKKQKMYPNGRKRASKACYECQKRHTRCGFERPCVRCVKLNLECIDVSTFKKRGRSQKKEGTPTTAPNSNYTPFGMNYTQQQQPQLQPQQMSSHDVVNYSSSTNPSMSSNQMMNYSTTPVSISKYTMANNAMPQQLQQHQQQQQVYIHKQIKYEQDTISSSSTLVPYSPSNLSNSSSYVHQLDTFSLNSMSPVSNPPTTPSPVNFGSRGGNSVYNSGEVMIHPRMNKTNSSSLSSISSSTSVSSAGGSPISTRSNSTTVSNNSSRCGADNCCSTTGQSDCDSHTDSNMVSIFPRKNSQPKSKNSSHCVHHIAQNGTVLHSTVGGKSFQNFPILTPETENPDNTIQQFFNFLNNSHFKDLNSKPEIVQDIEDLNTMSVCMNTHCDFNHNYVCDAYTTSVALDTDKYSLFSGTHHDNEKLVLSDKAIDIRDEGNSPISSVDSKKSSPLPTSIGLSLSPTLGNVSSPIGSDIVSSTAAPLSPFDISLVQSLLEQSDANNSSMNSLNSNNTQASNLELETFFSKPNDFALNISLCSNNDMFADKNMGIIISTDIPNIKFVSTSILDKLGYIHKDQVKTFFDIFVPIHINYLMTGIKEDKHRRQAIMNNIENGTEILRSKYLKTEHKGRTLLLDRSGGIIELASKTYRFHSKNNPSQLEGVYIFLFW